MRSSAWRVRRVAVGFVVASLTFVACGGGDDDGTGADNEGTTPGESRVLRVLDGPPDHLDPVTLADQCGLEKLRWVYDSLIRQNEAGELVPGLAERWESPDASTFVLHLREGVEFQDGTPFNAEAVKAHLERGQSEATSTIADVLSSIESIETPDELTVVLNLSAPRAGLLPGVFNDRAGLIPSPTALGDAGEVYGDDEAVGAGPYAYDGGTSGTDMRTVAWDGYWESDQRFFGGIDLVGEAEEFEAQRIVDGDADYVNVDTEALPDVEAASSSGGVQYLEAPSAQYGEFFINWSQEPFDDIKVRQALQHAIDRELLVETLTGGAATAAWSPIPPDSPAHDPAVDGTYAYDPERARELLAEAGYPEGVSFTAGMIEPAFPFYARFAQAVQDMVQESGFTIELEVVPGAEIQQRIYQDRDLAFAITAFAAPEDLSLLLTQKFTADGANNPSGLSVEGIDDLLTEAAATLDVDERTEIYRQAEKLVVDASVSIPVYHDVGISVFSSRLEGIDHGSTSCKLGNFVGTGVRFADEG